MDLFEHLDSFSAEAVSSITQKGRRQKVELYTNGLKAKIKQTQFALQKLNEFLDRTDISETSTKDELSIEEQVHFYCDTFWTFLYSSLDVLAQIVNQALNIGMNEKDVTFKQVRNTVSNPATKSKIDVFARSKIFINLDRYRNCSTHRRQICIQEVFKSTSLTHGYSSTSSTVVDKIIRTLCDNPLDLNPRFQQDRKIPDYLDKTLNRTIKSIKEILNATKQDME